MGIESQSVCIYEFSGIPLPSGSGRTGRQRTYWEKAVNAIVNRVEKGLK